MTTDLFEPVGPSPDEVANRLLAATLGAQELFAIYAGDRPGWYASLAPAVRRRRSSRPSGPGPTSGARPPTPSSGSSTAGR